MDWTQVIQDICFVLKLDYNDTILSAVIERKIKSCIEELKSMGVNASKLTPENDLVNQTLTIYVCDNLELTSGDSKKSKSYLYNVDLLRGDLVENT